MSRRLLAGDRFAVGLVGLVLLALGLLAIDWSTGTVFSLPDDLDASGVTDVVTSGWWPWVGALAGIVLGLLGLWWMLSHTPGRGPSASRFSGSDQSGTLEVDLRSVAHRVADRLQDSGPFTAARGTTTVVKRRPLIEVRARVETFADPDAVRATVRRAVQEVEESLDGEVGVRVLLDAPGRARRSDDRVRVD